MKKRSKKTRRSTPSAKLSSKTTRSKAPRTTRNERPTKAPSGRFKPVSPATHSKHPAKAAKGATLAYSAEFECWKSGTQLHVLSTESKVKRSKLRRAFIQLAGGKPAFKELRAAGAGGSVEPFGGKRSAGRSREVIALDDSKVKVLKSKDLKLKMNDDVVKSLDAWRGELVNRLASEETSLSDKLRLETGHENARRIVAEAKTDAKSKSWRVEHYQTALFGSALRLIAPDGKTYVRATATERADYIVQSDLGKTRWKIETEARLARTEAKQQEQVEKGKKSLERNRAKKRAAKKARKGGRR